MGVGEFDALTAEVTAGVFLVGFQRDAGGFVALEEQLDVSDVGRAVVVLIFHVVVAGSAELLDAELVEVGSEILKEVALEGIVAVAVDDVVPEGVGVELEAGFDFLLDVDVLDVELVLLGRLGGVQASVQRVRHRLVGFFRHSVHEM